MSDKTHYNEMNVISMHALIGSMSGSMSSMRSSRATFFQQTSILRACPIVRRAPPMVSGLHEWCREHGRDIQWLLDEGARVGVGYQDGRPFHGFHIA